MGKRLLRAAERVFQTPAGDDLALSEIDEALRHLQGQTGPQTEIVMGVIIDPQLQRRVQVILMITGLGAPTLEEAFMDVQKTSEQKRTPIPQIPVEAKPQPSQVQIVYEEDPTPVTLDERMIAKSSLDIPAFLRKRSRLVVATQP